MSSGFAVSISTLSGILDGIKDIGPKRKKLIYSFFSGKKKLKDTTLEELQSIPEISESIAEKVFNEIHNSKSI
jgi:excinuclease UvrABC nuclease subunit